MHSRVVDNDTIIVITDDMVPLIQQNPTLQALSFKCRQGTNSNAMSTIKNLYIFYGEKYMTNLQRAELFKPLLTKNNCFDSCLSWCVDSSVFWFDIDSISNNYRLLLETSHNIVGCMLHI